MAQILIRGQSFKQGISDFKTIIMDTIFCTMHFWEEEETLDRRRRKKIQGIGGH